MESSLFAKLPQELLDYIYELSLQSNRPTLELRDIKTYISLTQTSRQIRSETQPMLFALNNYSLTTSGSDINRFCIFLKAIGPKAILHIRSLRLMIIERIPCKGTPLQCSQSIEIRGIEAVGAADASGTDNGSKTRFRSIKPSGVESRIHAVLTEMGLQVRGSGSTWYTTATWYVGRWFDEVRDDEGSGWQRVL